MTIRSQVIGTLTNIRSLVSGASLRDLLPPSIVSTILFFRDSLPRALGFTEGARGHITGVVVFTVFLIVASATLLTYVAIVFFIVAMPPAVARLIPAVNDRWPLSVSSWPFWQVR